MAELSIKATLQGAAEAQAGLAALSAATKGLNVDNERLGAIQANLNKLAQEHQTGMAQRTAATQRLKDHTAELVRKFQEQEQTERAVHTATSQLTSSIGQMARNFVVTTFSVAALGSTLLQIFNSGRQADLTMVKLRASLEATGGAVGKTAQQLEEMSDALAKGTRFDNTGIQQAMQVLLTFDNVTGDIFEKAIRHAQNLSEKFGMDLSSAARMLGRALQEPGEGIQMLQRYLGTLNPELIKNIQNLNEQGRTAEAQAAVIMLLDGRMKDFAKTVGESAPASFDKMIIAWKSLLEQLGKGQEGGFWDFWTTQLDGMTAFFKNWSLIMRGISTERDRQALNDANLSAEDRKIIEKRLNESFLQIQREAEAEKQARNDAALAAWVKSEEDKKAKQKTFAEKQLKENEELTKKIAADEEKALNDRLERIDFLVKAEKMTLEQKVQLIDEELAVTQESTAAWLKLANARLAALDEIDKREDTNIKRVLERYDVDIKMAKATFAQKILFIDSQLAREEEGSDKWIALMKARQQTEEQAAQKKKQNEAEIQTALKKTQRSFAEQADEEIDAIRRTVFATEDLRLNALERLAAAYRNMGPEGEEAYDKVRKAMRGTETEAEKLTKRLHDAFGRIQFDLINIGNSLQSNWQNAFEGMLKGTMTFSEGVKALWKGIVDAVITEIARMVAQYLAAQAIMGIISIAVSLGIMAATGAPVAVAAGGDLVVTSPTTFLIGEGGVAARGFQHGGEGIFTSPTVFRAGEGNAERVRIEPLAGTTVDGVQQGSKEGIVTRPTMFRAGEKGPERVRVIPLAGGALSVPDHARGTMFTGLERLAKALSLPVRDVAEDIVEKEHITERGVENTPSILEPIQRPSREPEDGVAMRSFALGGEGVFTRPTLFRAGEGGPERVRVTPLAGGAGSGVGDANERVGKLEKTVKDLQALLEIKNKSVADLQKPAAPPSAAATPAQPVAAQRTVEETAVRPEPHIEPRPEPVMRQPEPEQPPIPRTEIVPPLPRPEPRPEPLVVPKPEPRPEPRIELKIKTRPEPRPEPWPEAIAESRVQAPTAEAPAPETAPVMEPSDAAKEQPKEVLKLSRSEPAGDARVGRGRASDAEGMRITNVFMGPNVMDAFSLRRFVREQERLITSEMRRRG
ncbi:MAG: phage tail length tape measure family protein [Candidatus Binatia bacterium]|nr:phage tail length tape measure family protein [Candidatus Binatia bacterium]